MTISEDVENLKKYWKSQIENNLCSSFSAADSNSLTVGIIVIIVIIVVVLVIVIVARAKGMFCFAGKLC